jgi:hypothetical protein
MEFFLFPLLLDSLILSQQLLIVVIIVIFRFRVHPWLLLLLLVIRLDERLRISILREWIISQIDQLPLGLIGSLDLFLHVWLVIANYVHIIVVDGPLIAIPNLLLLDYLYLSILLPSRLRFTLHQLRLEILLFQLVHRSLADLTLL